MIVLRCGAWTAGVEPSLGGSLAFLRAGSRDVLRPAPPRPSGPLDMSCFPLVPYANRIANAAFEFEDRVHHLARNFGDHPHSLHGCGWRAAWAVAAQDDAAVTLVHRHDPDVHWSFAYEAVQDIVLSEAGIRITLTLRNDAAEAMPAGLGLHPYFLAGSDDDLRFIAAALWLSDETMIPTIKIAPDRFGDFAAGAPAKYEMLIDHCWRGWDGIATLDGDGGTIRVVAEGTPFIHVYSPPGSAFVCLEPTTHMPDALNQPDPQAAGVTALAPGASMAIGLTIGLS